VFYVFPVCYSHMPIGMVWIYRLMFVFLFLCLQDFGNIVTDISGVA